MTDFDLNAYLSRAAAGAAPAVPQEDPNFNLTSYLKRDKVAGAVPLKVINLDQLVARNQRNIDNALVNKLGIDPNGLVGEGIDTALSWVKGANNISGTLLSAPINAIANLASASVPNDVVDAYSRTRDNNNLISNPEQYAKDTELLNQQAPAGEEGLPQTYLNRLKSADTLRGISKEIMDTAGRTDLGSTHDPINSTQRDAGSDAIDESSAPGIAQFRAGKDNLVQGNYVQGAAQIAAGGLRAAIFGSAAMARHPAAVVQYLAENSPQIALGVVSPELLGTFNTGYGLDTYRQGITDYQDTHNGALPDAATRLKQGLFSTGAAALEEIGSMSMVSGIKGINNGNGYVKGAAGILGGSLKEGTTEAAQTYMEGEADLKPATAESIVQSGVIGGAVGGGFHVMGHGIYDGSHTSTDQVVQQQATEEEFHKAIISGDVSALTNQNSKTYNPARAIQALNTQILNPLTPEADKQSAAIQASDIHDALDARANKISDWVSKYGPESAAMAQQKIDANNAAMATASPEQAAQLQEVNAALQDRLAQVAKNAPRYAEMQAKETTLLKQLDESQAALDRLYVDNTPSSDTVDHLVDQVNAPAADPAEQAQHIHNQEQFAQQQVVQSQQADQLGSSIAQAQSQLEHADPVQQGQLHQQIATQQDQLAQLQHDQATQQAPVEANTPAALGQHAADRLLTLTMTNPDAVSHEQINALLASEDSHLNEHQRQALRSFSEAQQAATRLKNSENVRTDIMNGGDGFKGLTQYRAQFRQALGMGNLDKAQAQVTQLRAFADSRVQKGQVIEAAYQAIKGTDTTLQVVKTDNGWERSATPLTQKELKSNSGITVDRRTHKLSTEVALEGHILSKMADSFDAMVANQSVPKLEQPAVAHDLNTAAPVVTENTDQAPVEEAPVPVDDHVTEQPPVVPEEQRTEGMLDPIKDTPKVGEAGVNPGEYTKGSMLGKFFIQQIKGAKDITARPLVAMKDFITRLKNDRAVAQLFLPDRAPLAPQQEKAVQGFLQFAKGAFKEIANNVTQKDKAEEYQWQDYVTQFRNADGTLPQNVTTAIAYAMFAHVNDGAGKLTNTNETINTLLGLDKEAYVSPTTYGIMARMASTERVAANSLGQAVYQALGLKAVKGAPVNEQARIQTALGYLALNSLVTMGVAEKVTLTEKEVNAMKGITESGEDIQFGEDHRFYRLIAARNEEGKLVVNDHAAAIREATLGSQGVLDKLFSVQTRAAEPTLDKQDFTQTAAQKTQQGISKTQAQLLNKAAHQEYTLKQNMWQVFGQLSAQARYAMAGVVNEAPVHEVNRRAQEAKNDGLMQEVDNAQDWFTKTLGVAKDGLETAFHFMPVVWSNYRVGLDQTVINPQTSKVHRWLIKQAAWNTQVDLTDANSKQMFQLRVLEGLGVKTENNKADQVIADSWAKKTKDPVIKAGVRELMHSLKGEEIDESKVVAAVKAGGEGYHTLAALVALAESTQAQVDGKTSFQTDLAGEVDGVTNGPQLSMLYFGTSSVQIMAQGGFSVDSNIGQYSDYKAVPGNHDMYQGLMSKILARMSIQNQGAREAMEAILGPLADVSGSIQKAGRDIVKTPLTAVMFGSGIPRAIKSMQETFIENIYTKLEKVAALPKAEQQDAIKDVVAGINTLLKAGGAMQKSLLHPATTTEAMMEHQFDKLSVSALNKAFNKVIGDAAKATLTSELGSYIENRDIMNRTASRTFQLYSLAESVLRSQILAAAGNTATRARKGVTENLHDLTQTQLAELNQRLSAVSPILHTALSLQSGERDAGMLLAKYKSNPNNSTAYASELNFGRPVGEVDSLGQPLLDKYGDMKTAKSTKAGGQKKEVVDPGVGTASRGIHSTDSANAVLTYGQHPALNVHDAVVTGIGGLPGTAQAFNQNTYNVMLGYSPLHEMAKTYEQTLIGFLKLMEDPAFAKEVGPQLEAVFTDVKFNGDLEYTKPSSQLYQIRQTAWAADLNKLHLMEQMTSVGQYATEQGSYKVTDADRAAAIQAIADLELRGNTQADTAAKLLDDHTEGRETPIKKTPVAPGSILTASPATGLNALETLKTTAPKSLLKAINTVQAGMQANNSTVSTELQHLDLATAATLGEALKRQQRDQQSVWGELGTPKIQSDPALVGWLQNHTMNTHQLINSLSEYVGQVMPESDARFHQELLIKIKAATKAIPVNLITAQSDSSKVLGDGVDKSRGWFAQQGNRAELNIKGPEFVESGITVELLTHELLHSATANIIQSELDNLKANPSYTSPALSLVQELDGLRAQAAQYLEDKGNGQLKNEFINATGSVHELVSWGLSSAAFQTQVLKNLAVKPSKGNTLLNGLTKFIRHITDLVFHGSPLSARERQATGLGLLLQNTAGLFEAAAQQKQGERDITLKYESGLDSVNSMSATQVYDSLAQFSRRQTTAAHDTQLRTLLSSIVSKLYDPRNPLDTQQALTNTDVYLKAVQTGETPFASRALASSFVMNLQEGYVLEHVEAVLTHAMDAPQTLWVRTALEKLFREAKDTLSPRDFHPGDWATAQPHEQALAEEKHRFLFHLEDNGEGKSAYLSRFAALGMASQEVSALLNFKTARGESITRDMPLNKKLIILFQKVMAFFGNLTTRIEPGQRATTQLNSLVSQLTDIQAKRKARLMDGQLSLSDKAENMIKGVRDKVRDGREKAGQSTFFKASSNGFIKLAGTASSTIAGRRVGKVMDAISLLRDRTQQGRQGMLMGLIDEVRGITDAKLAAGDLLKTANQNEQMRKQGIEYTAANVLSSFQDGRDLTQVQKEAMTKWLLRTNTQALLGTHDMAQIHELLTVPSKMAALRTSLEEQLLAQPHGDYYIRAIKQLAYHKVVGGSVSANQMLNSHSIANLYGTHLSGKVQESSSLRTEALLEPLMAVYAHGLVGDGIKKIGLPLLKSEALRGQGQNGVEMLLKLHQSLLQQSKEHLFKDQESLFQSGYVPEIHDPKIEVVMTRELHELDYLERSGFKEGTKAQYDSAVYGGDGVTVMVRRGSGQAGYLTGGVSLTGLRSKGSSATRQVSSLLDPIGTSSDPKSVEFIHRQRAAEIRGMFAPGSQAYNPQLEKTGRVIPVLSPSGLISDFRYTMIEDHRDSLLDRDSSMDQVMGMLAGSLIDKTTSPGQNIELVRAMYDQYKEDYTRRPKSYLEISADSPDTRIREQYRLLPQATKDEIRRVWGSNAMMIPADQLDLVMGYRKYSLTEPFKGVLGNRSEVMHKLLSGDYNDERNVAEKMLIGIANGIWGEKAAWRVGQAEDGIQEIMKGIKDILVIKNIATLLGNIKSNTSLLLAQGLSLKEIAVYHAIGIKGAMDYRRDNKRLQQLTQAIEAGYVPEGAAKLQQEVRMLQDRIARNPVKPMVDAGLMPSIVEDVETNDSRYSYSSRLSAKLDAKTQWVPKLAKTAVKEAMWFSHDSTAYKFLSQTTQLSDFVARYALHEHLTTRKQERLTSPQAMKIAEDSFINYDIPSHRSIQYMNDMGLLMFTKYFLRIQKPITRLFKEKPARVAALVAYGHYVNGASVLTDSSWLHHIGNNPFSKSVLNGPEAIGELPGVSGLLGLF